MRRLHVTITHETHRVASKTDQDTTVGIDLPEDYIALAAMSRNGTVRDSVVIEYPSINEQRHEFFTKRERMQKAEQIALETVAQTKERDYVHGCLHKISRNVVEWVSQLSSSVIVFAELKDMRDSID
jgi:putative transposase